MFDGLPPAFRKLLVTVGNGWNRLTFSCGQILFCGGHDIVRRGIGQAERAGGNSKAVSRGVRGQIAQIVAEKMWSEGAWAGDGEIYVQSGLGCYGLSVVWEVWEFGGVWEVLGFAEDVQETVSLGAPPPPPRRRATFAIVRAPNAAPAARPLELVDLRTKITGSRAAVCLLLTEARVPLDIVAWR